MNWMTLIALSWGILAPPPAPTSEKVAGVVRPVRWVRVAAETNGAVVERPCEEHDAIEKGGLVYRIEPFLKETALAAARAAVIDAEAQHAWARAELARQKDLESKDASNRSEVERFQARERSAWAGVLRARVAVDEAGFFLEKTKLVAPLTGFITRMEVEVGEYVVPGTFLYSIMDVRKVKIESFVSASLARTLAPGAAVELETEGRRLPARVLSVAPGSDNQARTFKVVLVADNEGVSSPGGPTLRPGTTVHWRVAP